MAWHVAVNSNYLTSESANNRTGSVLDHDAAVSFVDDHLRAVFRRIDNVGLSAAPECGIDVGAVRAPLEARLRLLRPNSVSPVASVVLPLVP